LIGVAGGRGSETVDSYIIGLFTPSPTSPLDGYRQGSMSLSINLNETTGARPGGTSNPGTINDSISLIAPRRRSPRRDAHR